MSNYLINGECLEAMAKLPDCSVDLILCDLPYGITQNVWDSIIPLDKLWEQYKRLGKPGAAIVLTATLLFATTLIASNLKWFRYEWVWQKTAATGFLDAKKKPLRNHEYVLVFCDKRAPYNPQMRSGFKPYRVVRKVGGSRSRNWNDSPERGTVSVSNGERYPVTVFEFAQDRPCLHPTQKPVALLEYMIRTYTNPGDTVLDNCMGSGSTGVACIATGRNFVGIELDSKYFQIAQKRVADAACQGATDAKLAA